MTGKCLMLHSRRVVSRRNADDTSSRFSLSLVMSSGLVIEIRPRRGATNYIVQLLKLLSSWAGLNWKWSVSL